MRQVQILMTAAPRYGTSPLGYFFRTLGQVQQQLAEWCREDPDSYSVFSGLTIAMDGDRSGNVPALKAAIAKTYPGHDVLWLEDDLLLCKNAIRYMCTYESSCDAAFTAFFECRHFREQVSWFTENSINVGLTERNEHLYHVPMSAQLAGLQAVLFPALTMHQLREYSAHIPLPDWIRPNDADISVSWWLQRMPAFCVHMPNLVQHIGRESMLLDGDGQPVDRGAAEFQSQNFPGVEFDAMTLRGT
jgi:hypothetical protein